MKLKFKEGNNIVGGPLIGKDIIHRVETKIEGYSVDKADNRGGEGLLNT